VTLTQLKVFVLVTRLGSMKAAASTLGVSEPAVSQALTALRNHLGDPLLVRSGASMELTPAGQRVIALASQIVSLAVDAEAAVREGSNAPQLLRVVATSTIADSIGPAVLQAFAARVGNVEINLGTATTAEMTALLHERLADVALGPKPLTDTDGLSIAALLRWRLVMVASAERALSVRQPTLQELSNEVWLTDPSGRDPASLVHQLLERLAVPSARVRVFPNQAAALDAAARGGGIVPAVDHLLERDLSDRGLQRIDVHGSQLETNWCVSSLLPDRRSEIASRFVRYLSTPDAHREMRHLADGVPAAKFRPPVYVTIWS
jgi:LysR family transcriptional regulator, low CO2-responsive transcriptional regulator